MARDIKQLSAFPLVVPNSGVDVEGGMTRLEYASIHIFAGMLANPTAEDYAPESLAVLAVSRAKVLFAKLEDEV